MRIICTKTRWISTNPRRFRLFRIVLTAFQCEMMCFACEILYSDVKCVVTPWFKGVLIDFYIKICYNVCMRNDFFIVQFNKPPAHQNHHRLLFDQAHDHSNGWKVFSSAQPWWWGAVRLSPSWKSPWGGLSSVYVLHLPQVTPTFCIIGELSCNVLQLSTTLNIKVQVIESYRRKGT